MASSSDSDDSLPVSEKSEHTPGSWCQRCESFFKACKIVARDCRFKLIGKLYAKNLEFSCLKSGHTTPISYSRRIQAGISCAHCRKNERNEHKAQMRADEERDREECARH